MPQEIIVQGTSVLQEVPTSPTWEFGETARVTRVFRSASYYLTKASAPHRGAYGTGEFAGMKVVSSVVGKERGQIGVLTVVMEGPPSGVDAEDVQIPADEFEIEYGQQELDLRKHPIYAALTKEDLWAIDAALNASDFQTQEFFDWITTGANGPACESLLKRLQQGRDKYAVYPPVLRWTSYFVDEPAASGGGYLEFPFLPLTPPPGFDYLRAGDSLKHNGTFYVLTRTWVGAPSWDNEIYPAA